MNTIKLKKEDNTQYFVTEMSEKDYLAIKKTSPKDIENLKAIYPINFNGVIGIGKLESVTASKLSNYVAYLKGFEPTLMQKRAIAFRDYTKTEEKQKEIHWLVNICSDSVSSAKTLIMTLRLPYICIWYEKQD